MRGHRVTAFTRDLRAAGAAREHVTWRQLDVLDHASVPAAIGGLGLDVLVNLYQPGNAHRDLQDVLTQSIAAPERYAAAARSLLDALVQQPSLRLIVVGGAGSLERVPGQVLADDVEGLRRGLRALGLPESYEAAVRGHRAALDVYRLSNRLWTYLSPAQRIEPGERTGRFRVGGDQVLTDAQGQSRISYEDCAVAVLDEAEYPRHVQRRFTIAY